MTGTVLRGLGVVVAALVLAPAAGAQLSVLDNGIVHVGVDLDRGGAIDLLQPSNGVVENLLADSEQAYSYGGNQSAAQVVAQTNNGHLIDVRAHDDDCGCTYETWVSLAGRAVHVRQRVTTERWSPSTQWWQETPPVYSGGTNTRVVAYNGGKVRDLTDQADYPLFQGNHLSVNDPEHWIALVGTDDTGVGLVEPDQTQFIAIAQPYESYVAGVRYELLDQNASYTYSYDLVLGSVDQIRAYAKAHQADARPDFHFAHDRQHFTFQHAHDLGSPIAGALRVRVDDPGTAEADGPFAPFASSRVPYLYVRAAWLTPPGIAHLAWNTGQVRLNPVLDAAFHTYRLHPSWSGTVTTLRLLPGADVDVTCISWKPCPVDRKAELALLRQPATPYLDSFARLDGWSVGGNSTGAATTLVGGVVRMTVAGNALPLPGQTYVSTGLYSRCTLTGNFDTQVDFKLETWPGANGVHVSFSIGDFTLYRQNENGSEQISSWAPPIGSNTADPSFAGTFRVTRTGATVVGSYLDEDGTWQQLGQMHIGTGPVHAGISLYRNATPATAFDTSVLFDNFRVTRGGLDCP